mmetsp:Transcript_24049/g.55885  ORF Transcript_24049/g.55885 Transcript_24049/m.55885 type:complete len:545 (+) Transcript_24049:109-1743(+)|eukprot:CAMPEP_0178418718 /NCGR_PEP_ID=MMETSP0689_2-20121128/25235_1 /TAXON_ID=160604 /ORGANISM="Amphidinium massartii, Strain CS-259" /LENGTH=544 /DNA_ID=CAMNT_0020040125 /DNA_START=102 /DNA_END=1736 /DNA_ORIENTATION=+
MAAVEEAGSTGIGMERRLSTDANDVVNRRPSYVAPPRKKSEVKCFGCCVSPPPVEEVDVVLVGGGSMSLTVGLMLKQLQPTWKIVLFERLGAVAEESTNGWNNAGTGHSALCEPNYTPDKGDTVDITKAVVVNENFQLSRQYWAYLKKNGLLDNTDWITPTPHLTFAYGEDQITWLQKRYAELSKNPLFKGMQYTEDPKKLMEWAPLMMEGRDAKDKVAMTNCTYGTDVDFGALTREMAKGFMKLGGNMQLFSTVTGLKKEKEGTWLVKVAKSDVGAQTSTFRSKFVFVGAGGWALLLLQKSGIPEIKGFMGFPISGEFLVCQNPAVVKKHPAKVYGKAAIGAPPMSVPHLDKRSIGGKEMVLFGPFAGFSPRYLKTGSLLDLFKSIRPHNLIPAAAAGLQNLDLTIYLVKQLAASNHQKYMELKRFVPNAEAKDWLKCTAGQRVQIMKKDPKKIGILQFGTEVVAGSDGSIAGLLGASPGASTAVQVALDVLRKCFKKEFEGAWNKKIREMIPSFDTKLSDDPSRAVRVSQDTGAILGIGALP